MTLYTTATSGNLISSFMIVNNFYIVWCRIWMADQFEFLWQRPGQGVNFERQCLLLVLLFFVYVCLWAFNLIFLIIFFFQATFGQHYTFVIRTFPMNLPYIFAIYFWRLGVSKADLLILSALLRFCSSFFFSFLQGHLECAAGSWRLQPLAVLGNLQSKHASCTGCIRTLWLSDLFGVC